jgi:hypothetical protein
MLFVPTRIGLTQSKPPLGNLGWFFGARKTVGKKALPTLQGYKAVKFLDTLQGLYLKPP